MARRAIPQYPIDGEAIYVPDSDGAWDHDRIRAEIDDLDEKAALNHPYLAYRTGKTRFRLDPVSDYLDPEKNPERWHLKRPPPEVMRECHGLFRKAIRFMTFDDDGKVLSREPEADTLIDKRNLLLFRHGLKKLENSPFHVKRRADGAVDDSTISAVDEAEPGLVSDIGSAVSLAFEPLKEDEGK